MVTRLLISSLLAVALAAPTSAQAQDDFEDDLLAPLTPGDAPRPKRKKKRAPAPARPALPNDDLVSPLEAPTELVVTLAAKLEGAKLFIDGKEIGPVNGQAVEVTPGEHRILVRRVGFNDFLGTVSVPDGGRESVTVSLFANGGVLSVQPNVPAADVFVNSKLIGKSPIKELVLKPGAYEIKVTKEGYSMELSRLSIRAGKDYILTPMLNPALAPDRPEKSKLEPVASVSPGAVNPATQLKTSPELGKGTPWYGQWYVWAGAVAVVAAAGGGTYAAMNSQPSALTPEEVCGRTCDAVLNGARMTRRTVMFAPPKLSF